MYGSEREPQLWRTSTLIHRLPFAQHSHRSSDGIAWRYCALSPVAIHYAVFGATLAQAGLLLAANRLIRLLGYGWIAKLYMRKGSRLTCGLAVTAASLCTL